VLLKPCGPERTPDRARLFSPEDPGLSVAINQLALYNYAAAAQSRLRYSYS